MPKQRVATAPNMLSQAISRPYVTCLSLVPFILTKAHDNNRPSILSLLQEVSHCHGTNPSPLTRSLRTGKCPPCFNCMLPAFTCGQYGECDPYNGQCNCPPGWGGIDCLTPRKCWYLGSSEISAHVCTECDSLADGVERHLREDGKECQCKDGWGGINCNGMFTCSVKSAVV